MTEEERQALKDELLKKLFEEELRLHPELEEMLKIGVQEKSYAYLKK